jgi:2-polyprenyl-3-methyl-5-hydroxy-6-metoxy-1,4-benzoquinol methylase
MNKIQGSISKCRICGNEKQNKTYKIKEMMFGYRDIFPYFQCSQCDCLQIESFPENIAKYYSDNYYSYQASSNRNKLKKILAVLRNRYALFGMGIIGRVLYAMAPDKRLKIFSFLSIKENTSILDVGCGAGRLLYALREAGVKNLLGVDPFNEKDIQYENGLKIQKKEIHEVENEWDVITFHHSFEHISNPAETLRAAANLLAPDGRCVIRIPIVPCYAWEHYGVNWVQLDAPRHFFLHSIKSMNILAAKVGLEIYKVDYDSTALQLKGSELYSKDIPLMAGRSKASIFSMQEKLAFKKKAKELNENKQGDQAAFYLKKIETN